MIYRLTSICYPVNGSPRWYKLHEPEYQIRKRRAADEVDISVLVIAAILLVTAGCTQNSLPVPGPGNPSLPGDTTAAGSGHVPSVAAGGKVIAAYWYLYPDPNDDTYPLVMSAKDRIPWTKINRLYIGFATVKDGVLTDLPTGDSPEDTARRAEMQRRIREIVALCRQEQS